MHSKCMKINNHHKTHKCSSIWSNCGAPPISETNSLPSFRLELEANKNAAKNKSKF